MKIYYSILLLAVFSQFSLFGQSGSSEDFWIPTAGQSTKVKGDQIAINSKGIVLTFYNERIYGGQSKTYLFRSSNSGNSWTDVASEIPVFDKDYVQVNAIRINKTVTSICSIDSVFFVLTQRLDGGLRLLRSMTDGKSWELINDSNFLRGGLSTSNNNSLIIDDQFYTASNSSFLRSQRSAQIYESVDYGKTFKEVFQGVISDPDYPVFLYDSHMKLILNNHKTTHLKYGKRYYKRNGENIINTARETDFEHMRSPMGPPFTYGDITIFEVEKGHVDASGNVYMKYENEIYKSTNSGKTFNRISSSALRQLNEIKYVSCTGNIYISGYRSDSETDDRSTLDVMSGVRPKRINSSFRSIDGGLSWQELEGLDDHLFKLALAPDGAIHVITTANGLFKSIEKECTDSPSNEEVLTYGTTVITHGFQLTGELATQGDWTYETAKRILALAGKGRILRYKKENGDFEVIKDQSDGEPGEQIIIFDWASESNDYAKGYSEAAGDALFASLILGAKEEEFKLDNLHFIGHSRGTVVNTLAIERLLVLKKNYPSYSTINIEQATNIDAHDWGIGDVITTDLDDAHPDIFIATPEKHAPNNGTISWKGVDFNDSYYQDITLGEKYVTYHGIRLLSTDLVGREILGAKNHVINEYEGSNVSHGVVSPTIQEVYLNSINELSQGEKFGYGFSRLLRGQSLRIGGNGFYEPKFSFFKNIEETHDVGQINRIQGLMNGGFERFDVSLDNVFTDAVAPGWIEHGGSQTNYPNSISYNSGYAELTDFYHFREPVFIKHNRLYVPSDANSIEFQIKTRDLETGILVIYATDVIHDYPLDTEVFRDTIKNEITNFQSYSLDISGFKDKVITLRFEFNGKAIKEHVNPVLAIDEIKLSKDLFEADNIQESENNFVQSDAEASDAEVNIGIFNGSFISLDGWQYSHCEVEIEQEAVAIKPQRKNIPAILKNRQFKIPNDARQLKFSFHKGRLKKADLNVIIRELASGALNTVYEEEIRVSILANISEELDKVNQTLETSEFDAYKKQFEEIAVDITPFRGKVVELQFIYIPRGNGTPKLFLDDVLLAN